MRIVFGMYSFKIKSYSPEDLNISNDNKQDISFEVRQNVFHLSWIPFFSIGKIYGMRKEGELYHIPDNLIALIKSKGKISTPWYSFLIPILVVLGFVIYLLDEEVQDIQWYQKSKATYEFSISQIDTEMTRLSSNHFIKLRNLANINNTQGLYLKVIQVDDSLIYCSKIETGLEDYEALPYVLKDFYSDHRSNLDTLKYSINQLKNAICRDFKVYHNQQKFGIKLFNDNNLYIIEAIEYIDGPVIKDRGTGSWGISMELHNFGSPADLVEIRNLENEIMWLDSLPMHISTDSGLYDYFRINGTNYPLNSKYKILLVFQDSIKKQYEFIIEGKNLDKKITLLAE
jgi:hypothetical protein